MSGPGAQDLAVDLSAKRLKMAADGKPMDYSGLDLARGYPSPYLGMTRLPTPIYPATTAPDMDRAMMSLHPYSAEELSKCAATEQQYADYAKALASFPSYMTGHLIGH